jgi:glutamate dehydrogenase/leucine dehydrogenase
MPVPGTTVAVQGFGNVGSVAAQLLQREGCKIVAISDRSVRAQQGRHRRRWRRSPREGRTARSRASTGGHRITNDELLTLEVDVLLPAALENVITRKNAANMRAKIICEGANGPTTAARRLDPRGEGHLRDPRHPRECRRRDGVVLRVGAGRGGYFWAEDVVNERLRGDHDAQLPDVLKLAKQHKVNMRTAAYMLSISRVATVHKLRGIYA